MCHFFCLSARQKILCLCFTCTVCEKVRQENCLKIGKQLEWKSEGTTKKFSFSLNRSNDNAFVCRETVTSADCSATLSP
jgi:hypothetical protein